GITGVLVGPLPHPSPLALPWASLSAAAIAYSLTEPRLHRAADNHCASARLAVAHLRAGGRKRIALALSAEYDRRVNGLWSAGYMWQTHEEGIADPSLLHRPSELHETTFMSWVRTTRPDAIIGNDPRILPWLKRAGMHVPGDIAYADLDL